MRRIGISLLILAEVFVSSASFAAKKDFKGLFGNYRREKFTENEARDNEFGMDIMLSTLFPLTGIVSSTEDRTQGATNMPSSNFFNVEGNVFFTLDYHWQIFGNFGYYFFDTRKENTIFTLPDKPQFQQFEMTAIPLLLGVKYRFSTDDIVPYVGVAAGISMVRRKAFYDYSTLSYEENVNAVSGQVIGGIEFYFHPRAGLRL